MHREPLSTRLAEWRQAGQTFRFRGHDIFFRTQGTGPTLLLLHGFPTASWDWHAVWPALADRFRVLACDFLGFGFSAKPRRHNYRLVKQADLQEELAEALDAGAVHVLAHDYGVSVAQELLARQAESPDLVRLPVRSVVFLNGGLFPTAHRARLVQKLLASPVGGLVTRLMSRRGLGRSFRAIFGRQSQPSDAELDEFWSLVAHGGGNLIGHKLMAYLAERRQHAARWERALAQARVPLRLINGVDDPVSGGHMADAYERIVPNADVVRLTGIGHYPQTEAPAQVLAAFLEFHAAHALR